MRPNLTTEGIAALAVAAAVVTTVGGVTSHAAVVAPTAGLSVDRQLR